MRFLPQKIIIFFVLSISVVAQSPHGKDFNLDCELCHQALSWKIDLSKVKFDHSITKFELVGQHKAIDCRSCHVSLEFSNVKTNCISCHTDIHQGTVGKDCAKCHSPKSWMVQDINGLHQKSRFPLLGNHLTADCQQCHTRYTDLYFEPLDVDCYSCHLNDYNSAQNPNHVTAGFSTDCQDCHQITATTWNTINVIHDFFPLVGGHAIADCFECHEQGGNFTGLSPECISCHQTDYNNTTDPNHVQNNYPTDCTLCHTINGWSPANFDHNSTAFPLTGKHITVDCQECHSTGYTGTPTDCYSCHRQDYENTEDPNHVLRGYSTNCTECHTTNGWEDLLNFDHNITPFPLSGAHVETDCSECHQQGFSNTPTTCFGCHESDFNTAQDPNHVTGNFPTECTVCHSTTAWSPAQFDHSLTQFPLTGAHITTECISCHQQGYTNTPTECVACHQTDFNNTTNPNHQALMLPTDCESCHTTDPGWIPATFPIHNQFYELVGAHASISNCADCHSGNYNTTPNTCIGCHQNDFNNTTDPPHQTLNLSVDCLECHTMNGWTPANFDHTFYPISSAHNEVTCGECHSETNYQPQCLSCHLDDFNEEHDPGDPTDCWACHSTFNWDSNFNHNSTNFPLTGAHTSLSCQDCHSGGYQGTPTECVACHQTNYNNTTNPNHQTLMLPTTCESCHTTNPNWTPATFPIHSQFFELLGAHLNIINCDNCHNGNYTNPPNTCIGCHQNNYNGTTNPPHQVLNFSLDCLECHTMNGWTPASFNHTFYPISGQHNNVSCIECHSQANYQQQCLSCHLNDFNEAHNQGDPTDCWLCHSTYNWDSNFNHSSTNFPLTGAHVGLSCLDCHSGGYQGTPTECIACHQSNYNNTTNPDHQALMLPTTCETCHTTNPNWTPATFPIHSQFFELLGAHANISNCDDCHNGNYVNPPNTCIGCHQNEYNSTNDPPHQVLNFSFDCLECHTMNGWTPANFNHSFYPVSNHHSNVNCNQCHSEANYQPQCLSCHLDDFNEEHNPGDPTDCWNCHSANNWGNSFNIKTSPRL